VCRGEGTRKRVQTRVVSTTPPSFYYSCPPEEVDPLCPATARPPTTQGKERESEQVVERYKQRGRGGGGNKDYGRKSGGGFVKQLLVSLFGCVGLVQAAFAPADQAALKAAVGTCTASDYDYFTNKYTVFSCTGGCLGETMDGSCPIFAASNVTGTGNPYGVIGDWDVSSVTSMESSKCTLYLSLSFSLSVAMAPPIVVCC